MPRLQTVAALLNRSFTEDNVAKFASDRDRFAPGRRLGDALDLLLPKKSPLYIDLVSYVESFPGSFHEIIRSTIYYALSTSPPTLVTFAWAPGYDFELTTWQAPDTRQTRGGITVLLKSRYPSDAHPIGSQRASRRRS